MAIPAYNRRSQFKSEVKKKLTESYVTIVKCQNRFFQDCYVQIK